MMRLIEYIYGEMYLWWILHLRKRYRMRMMQQACARGKGWSNAVN